MLSLKGQTCCYLYVSRVGALVMIVVDLWLFVFMRVNSWCIKSERTNDQLHEYLYVMFVYL